MKEPLLLIALEFSPPFFNKCVAALTDTFPVFGSPTRAHPLPYEFRTSDICRPLCGNPYSFPVPLLTSLLIGFLLTNCPPVTIFKVIIVSFPPNTFPPFSFSSTYHTVLQSRTPFACFFDPRPPPHAYCPALIPTFSLLRSVIFYAPPLCADARFAAHKHKTSSLSLLRSRPLSTPKFISPCFSPPGSSSGQNLLFCLSQCVSPSYS